MIIVVFLCFYLQINYCLVSRLFPTLPPDPLDLECIRLYISLPLLFLLYSQDCNNYKILLPYSNAFLNLSSGAKNLIGELYAYLYLILVPCKVLIPTYRAYFSVDFK